MGHNKILILRNSSSVKPEHINSVYDDTRIEPAMETINTGLQTSINENPSLRSQLSLAIRTHIEAVKAFDETLRRQILDAGPSDFAKIDLKSITANGSKTLDSNYALYDATTGVLDGLLAHRIARFNQRRALSGYRRYQYHYRRAVHFINGRSISRPIAELKKSNGSYQ
jgi:hypothetical protein